MTAAQPDEHRHRAGGAADDDVLRAPRLEPDRVHEDVEEHGAHRERRRQQVDRRPEQRERERLRARARRRAPRSGETSPSGSGRCAVRRITWSRSRSIQQLMVLAPPAGERTADEHLRRSAPSDGSSPAARIIAGTRGDEQQLDDARLGERGSRRARRAGPACPAVDAAETSAARSRVGAAVHRARQPRRSRPLGRI